MVKDKRPAMQFYIGDWKKDPEVRACSLAARGLWIEMLFLMYESPRRGYLIIKDKAPSVEALARNVGAETAEVQTLLKELDEAGVYSIEDGIMYCRRMVRDAKRTEIYRNNGVKGGNPALVGNLVNQNSNPRLNQKSNPPLKPEVIPFVEDEDEDAVPSLSSGSNPLADFERWFNSYPKHRRTDYNGCLREWADTHCDSCPSEVIDGLEAWKASEEWRVEAGKFVPAARKFLTTRKWESRPNAPEAIQCDPKARRRNESDGEHAMRLLQEGVA